MCLNAPLAQGLSATQAAQFLTVPAPGRCGRCFPFNCEENALCIKCCEKWASMNCKVTDTKLNKNSKGIVCSCEWLYVPLLKNQLGTQEVSEGFTQGKECGVCFSSPRATGSLRWSHNLGPVSVLLTHRKILCVPNLKRKNPAQHHFGYSSPGVMNDDKDFPEMSHWQVSFPEPEGPFRQLLIPENSSATESLQEI